MRHVLTLPEYQNLTVNAHFNASPDGPYLGSGSIRWRGSSIVNVIIHPQKTQIATIEKPNSKPALSISPPMKGLKKTGGIAIAILNVLRYLGWSLRSAISNV